MVKPLTFKGDKKSKKRKRPADDPSLSSAAAAAPQRPSSPPTAAAAAPAPDEDDTWVSALAATDITGPVLLVLASSPLTCLAADAAGSVFASALENVVEGDAGTAEPHDVRQVWVANRVSGMEGMSLRGSHGRYLSCDRSGLLAATAPAVSPEETFVAIPVPDMPDGCFALQTAREKFLCVEEPDAPAAAANKGGGGANTASDDDDDASDHSDRPRRGGAARRPPTVRGDADSARAFGCTVRVRMQARFKPRTRAVREEEHRRGKVSRKELEAAAGRRLEDDEVKRLKRARREGDFHEAMLDVKVKGKHDKFA